MSENLWPLPIVAAEIGCGVRDVERMANGSVILNDGIRCVPGNVVRDMVANRDAKIAATRAEQERQRDQVGQAHGANITATRRRIRALAKKQQATTIVGDEDLSVSALANIKSDETAAKAETAGRRFAEMSRGTTFHSYRHER